MWGAEEKSKKKYGEQEGKGKGEEEEEGRGRKGIKKRKYGWFVLKIRPHPEALTMTLCSINKYILFPSL